MFDFLKKFFGSFQERTLRRFSKLLTEVNRFDAQFSSLSDEDLRKKTEEFRARNQKGESLDELLPEAYAVVKNVCRRLCGTEVHVSGYNQKWDMVPYDVQILGAIAMHQGFISEMQTGEGKTLTATLPLYLNALSGKPVHLVTVNDYLVMRDCAWVGSVLRWLGLTTGVLTTDIPPHKRKEVYASDVVYGTASEFGFDYLRDNAMCHEASEQVQRGYYFAIIDEIDSILIDEARTPLIISGPTPKSFQMYEELKEGIAELVKNQKEICNRLANEAKKELESYLTMEVIQELTKEQEEKIKAACQKLWVVSKGMPYHKILRRIKEQPDLRAEIDSWDLYYHLDQNKEEKAEMLLSLLVIVDEKGNEFEITDKGIQVWAATSHGSMDDFIMLDLGHEYAKIDEDEEATAEAKLEKRLALTDEDARRKERSHNIRQLLRAHLLMEKDIDYIVDNDKIVIIDEHTGRPQPGRRFSDGLHQAIEAKENVVIQKETQTYATITLQNYFRMYGKLAGMTGTAITESAEFKEIYKLDVLQIPTYKKCQRFDFNDEIYMTEREKYNALLKEIREVHEKGRPILIGTESVEASEKVSRILKQNKIPHTVLNAKHNATEAEIIAEAGNVGAVTVSTNMAGRGTDIKLKEDAAKRGGLHVIGTTRYPSRRNDRQLRGRSARLGDPGSSKFFISFEDQLLRLFSSPRITTILKKFRPPEGEAISASILNRSIETAQKRVEGRNYTIRKYTLEYDDVMNRQRQEVYNFRNEILHSEDLLPNARAILENAIAALIPIYFISHAQERGWDFEGFRQHLMSLFPVHFEETLFDNDHYTQEQIEKIALERVITAFETKFKNEVEKAQIHFPHANTHLLGQKAIRTLIVNRIDSSWQDHLLSMDHLRSDVSLRSVAQKDPLTEFKHEAFRLFHDLSSRLHIEVAKNLFKFEIAPLHPNLLQEILSQMHLESQRLIFEPIPEERAAAQVIEPITNKPTNTTEESLRDPKVGRNDFCPCKSGKKFKKCCGAGPEEVVS